ncbi:baculoviral IAP repeat-containing protein 5 [Gastrophryne carolinensis]
MDISRCVCVARQIYAVTFAFHREKNTSEFSSARDVVKFESSAMTNSPAAFVLPPPAAGEPEIPDEWRLYLLDTRIRTFSNWPFTEGCACTPEKMAEAGFIHCPGGNSPDVAQCFFCLKELEGWEPDDDPMEEHKKHSSACLFLTLKKRAEELTLSEFLKLDKERVKIRIQKHMNQRLDKFQEEAKRVRENLLKLDQDEAA